MAVVDPRLFEKVMDNGQVLKAVTWSVSKQITHGASVVNFDYYACFVYDKQLWFLTGPADWYGTREGITSEELLEILAMPDVLNVFGTIHQFDKLT